MKHEKDSRQRSIGLLTAHYDRQVDLIVSTFTKGVRNASEAELPRFEKVLAEILKIYIDHRTEDATFPQRLDALRSLEHSILSGQKGWLARDPPRKLPADSELRTEFSRLVKARGEAEARSVIHSKYSRIASRQGINAALRRSGCGTKRKKLETQAP